MGILTLIIIWDPRRRRLPATPLRERRSSRTSVPCATPCPVMELAPVSRVPTDPPPAAKEGFTYSGALTAMSGKKWNDNTLDKYLKSPAEYAPGNAMAFAGIPNGKDRGDVVAYLKANA